MADDLEKITSASEKAYLSVSNLELEKIKELMAAETWLDSSECLEYGFATEIIKEKNEGKSNQSAKKKVLELIKNAKQEDNIMKIGDFTVEEYDGGILIKKADEEPANGGDDNQLTEEQVNELAKKIATIIGGNK